MIFASDIGCYTLGISPPYETADYLLAMGSSVGDGCGFSIATNQHVMSFIGDSTFFHSGIAPLINAIHNKNRFVLTILDNRITAMTGGQPNPGIPVDGMGDEAPAMNIEKIVEAVGVEFLKVVNPHQIGKTVKAYKEAIQSVIDGTFTEEKKDEWDRQLATVFNRGFWDGYYQGQTMGEWNKNYGSNATEKKVYVGKGMKYFSKLGVAEFAIEASEISVGDKLLITGPTTGVMYLDATEIRYDLKPVDTAKQGWRVSIPVPDKVRPSDKLFKLEQQG